MPFDLLKSFILVVFSLSRFDIYFTVFNASSGYGLHSALRGIQALEERFSVVVAPLQSQKSQ